MQKTIMHNNMTGVDVYLEKRKQRLYVGCLEYNNASHEFIFKYASKYANRKDAIPLGPELGLLHLKHTSKDLFPSLYDRIPSQHNPAYKEYCQNQGIDVNEENPLILLCTIGRKGPSSFIFEPHYQEKVSSQIVADFRHKLGLTLREFSSCFQITYAYLNKYENGQMIGVQMKRHLEVLIQFPEVAYASIERYGGMLQDEKRKYALDYLKHQIQEKGVSS